MRSADLLVDLDAAQRRAVTTNNALVAVIAGAGSGKTRVLTRRVAYRIAEGTADPAHTLVLTFTREAAGELRRRFPLLGLHERVMAGTFHSVCRQLLHRRWEAEGRRPPTLRADRTGILRELGGHDIEALLSDLDWAASRGWSGDDMRHAVQAGHRTQANADRVAELLDRYEKEKTARRIIDMDDLLKLTVHALHTDTNFAEIARWRFRHLLVDEAQDLSPLQQQLIDLLRAGNDDLFLVGDPAQSIYGFAGSDASLLTDVATRFPGIEVLRLPVNHRSTPQVVAAGRHALAHSGQPTELLAELIADRDQGALVEVHGHADETAEAQAVAALVAATPPNRVRAGEVAVLARTHALLQAARPTFAAAGVPVQQLATGPGSTLSPQLRAVYRLAHSHQMRAWAQNQREQAAISNDADTELVVAAVFEFLRESPTGAGPDFEAWVELTNPFNEQPSGVQFLTFHAAKGREWHTVFLLGCETGLMPHRSATTRGRQLEESRLLYVALTRATDRLVVNWAERRGGYQRKLTPFLERFESSAPNRVGPPAELRGRRRMARRDRTDRLEQWRHEQARRASILPTQLVSDAQLRRIAQHQPRTPDELDDVTGIGLITARRLFTGIQAALERE